MCIRDRAKKMTYDRRGYLSSESTVRGPQEPDAEAFNEQKISYAYDSRGNVTDVDYAFRSGSVSGLRYEYDSDGKVTRVKAKNGLIGHDTVREYEYDSFGRVSRVTDHLDVSGSGSGRLVKEYRYDLLGRLHAIRITDPDTEEVKEASLYHHDKAGNIIKEETVSEYAGNGGTRYTKEYEYDEAGRLTKSIVTDERRTSLVVTNGEDAPVSETRYSYDEAGNLEREVSGATEKTYDHNGLDQLESVAEWDTSDHSLVSYTDYMYDANGNRIREVKGGTEITMGYNAFDMMTSYEKKENGETVFLQKNIFDGNGRRVEKQEIREKQDQTINLDDSAESDVQLEKVTKKYIYQGDTVPGTDTASIDVTGFDGDTEGGLEEISSFNILAPGGNVISASRKNEGDADASESWYNYNTDHQGSTTSIVDRSGAAVATYEYDDYGSITEETDTIDNEICYTGQYYDEGTGLYYYNARYYDSQNACFTSMDTYRGDNTLPLTLNLYMYCGGNPINFTDPTGHRFWNGFKKFITKKYTAAKEKRQRTRKIEYGNL